MTASILLLDPYRSALMLRGIRERVLHPPKDVDISKTPTMLVGNDENLQSTVLQFATLFDEVLIVHHEKRGENVNEKYNLKALSALPLQDMGLIKFTAEPGDAERERLWQKAQSIEDLWAIDKNSLDELEPLVIPMLLLKRTIPHESVYRFLRYVRSGETALIEQMAEKIPSNLSYFIPHILKPDRDDFLALDFVVFSTLNELKETERVVEKRGCRVAHMPFSERLINRHDIAREATKLFEIVIEELLQEQFLFPVPDKLTEVQKLRNNPDIAAFRETFQPWLETLANGELEDEKRLRKEVKSSIKRFQNSSRAKKISDILAYVAIPAGFVPAAVVPDPVTKVVGAMLGLAGIGLPKLAERWLQQGKWVSLCRKSHNILNLNYPTRA